MYKLNKIRGFVAIPIIIGSAVLAVGILGGLAYEYKDKLSFSGIDKNKMLAQVNGGMAVQNNIPSNQSCSSDLTTRLPDAASLDVSSPTVGQVFNDGDNINVKYEWSGVPVGSGFIVRIWVVASKVSELGEGGAGFLIRDVITTVNGSDSTSYQLPHDMVADDYTLRFQIFSNKLTDKLNSEFCELNKLITFHVNSSITIPLIQPEKATSGSVADTYSSIESIQERLNRAIAVLPALQQQIAVLNASSSLEIINSVQVSIANMIALVSSLQTALAAINQPSVKVESNFSYTWQKNLFYGMTDDNDVLALQKALTLEGVYNGPLSGNFLGLTRSGVLAFQKKHNFTSVSPGGYVGPYTIQVLNDLYSK